LGSLEKDYYQPITKTYAPNIIVGNKDSLGMDPSLPCNQRNGCMMQSSLGGSDTGETEQGVFRITQSQDKANKIDGERKTFFATPFFWKYVMDGEIRGAN
jgi:hypothetical protein